MLKPSSKDFDCGPEGCDSLCPGYFKTIVLPREQDNKKTITITLPDQSPITLPGCTITRGVCEEVTTSAGFENVTLPNEPFHFFAVDQDILLHDLIFEHSTNLFRHDFAHENFEHTSTDPLCQLKLSNPANPFVSECALSLRGKRVGRVIIVKDPNAVISYRNAPLKEPLAKIQDVVPRWSADRDPPFIGLQLRNHRCRTISWHRDAIGNHAHHPLQRGKEQAAIGEYDRPLAAAHPEVDTP